MEKFEKNCLIIEKMHIYDHSRNVVEGYFSDTHCAGKEFFGIDNLKKFQPSVPTKIYDVSGELISELFRKKGPCLI